MRRSKLVSTISTLAFAPALVQAQSSVTLYGLVDAGLGYNNNQRGSKNFLQTSGRMAGSRWGLKGVEDLGGGLSAVFTLENGFRPNDGTLGTAGREFGRSAFVGLAKTGIGALTFGRQYEPIADLAAQYSGPGTWSPSTHIGDNDNLNQGFRINNAVKFRSATLAGFTVDGLYGFSNQATNGAGQGFSNNRVWGIATSYVAGPLSVGGGYVLYSHPNATTNTNGAVGGGTTTTGDDYSTLFFYGLNGGVQRQQIAVAGASYLIGSAALGFAYSHTELNYNDGSSRKFSNYDANVRYNVTPAFAVIGVYAFTDGRADGLPGTNGANLKPKWHQFTLGLDYALSKRTDLYFSGVYQLAAGDASTLVGSSYQKIASISYASGPSSTNRQVAAFTGIRAKF